MKTILQIFALIAFAGMTINVNGQIKVDVKKKVTNQSNNRVNQRTDQTVGKGIDAVESGIKGVFRKKDKTDQETPETEEKQQNGNQDNKASDKEQTKLAAYSKYDFIPGEKVVFYDDFSQDAVGDFPVMWNTNGSAEIVTTNLFPGHWMKFNFRESIWTDELLDLPDNYTIEFDIIPIKGEGNRMTGYQFQMMQANNPKAWDGGTAPGKGGFNFNIEYSGRPSYSTWLNKTECQNRNLSGFKNDAEFYQQENQKFHIAIWIQKSRVRLYQGENKLIDLPKAFPTECIKIDRLRFQDGAAMVSNVRIAIGAPDMRNKLITEGKLVTYGIYFDVNKDVVKPESYGTLKEIAAVLNENPDVRVKIIGHTDSDGADAANLDLSKRRGASVKDELVKNFGIDASRLESDGLGETQPVAPNDNTANKALNRRVEFIKL